MYTYTFLMTQNSTTIDSSSMSRQAAADKIARILDAQFFRALCEPVRIEIILVLIRKGRSDVGAIAEELPQDRSVISRHLQVLERGGIVCASQEGRHVFYELDASASVQRFEAILGQLRALLPLCCPAKPR